MKSIIAFVCGVGVAYFYLNNKSKSNSLIKKSLEQTKKLLDGTQLNSALNAKEAENNKIENELKHLPLATPASFSNNGYNYVYKDGKYLREKTTLNGFDSIELDPDQFLMAYTDTQDTFM